MAALVIPRARRIVLLTVIIVAVALSAGRVGATVITTGCVNPDSCTMAELLAGGTITVDDKLFRDWTLELSLGADLDLITVSGLDDQPFNPGLQFSGNDGLTVVGAGEIDLAWNFTVDVLRPHRKIHDNELALVAFGFSGEGGRILIRDSKFSRRLLFLGETQVEADNLFQQFDLFDSVVFAPQTRLIVEKEIRIEGDFLDETVVLDTFVDRFSQIPAPATLVLVALGLVGLGVMRRRAR
jgi:hypothetical protein